MVLSAKHSRLDGLGLEYIWLAPHFVEELLDACDGWEGNDAIPKKLQELIMVLRLELAQQHK